mmetsp:Transcript_27511/g.65412  ORF Transcript_27511/g.65412 Transcript_27511/m.65412 type:complete len:270 (-) Transcript_27511:126-935(-)
MAAAMPPETAPLIPPPSIESATTASSSSSLAPGADPVTYRLLSTFSTSCENSGSSFSSSSSVGPSRPSAVSARTFPTSCRSAASMPSPSAPRRSTSGPDGSFANSTWCVHAPPGGSPFDRRTAGRRGSGDGTSSPPSWALSSPPAADRRTVARSDGGTVYLRSTSRSSAPPSRRADRSPSRSDTSSRGPVLFRSLIPFLLPERLAGSAATASSALPPGVSPGGSSPPRPSSAGGKRTFASLLLRPSRIIPSMPFPPDAIRRASSSSRSR